MESGRCVAEAERHNAKFVMPLMSSKGSLWIVRWVHPNLMKSLAKIEFRKPRSITEIVKKFFKCWHRKTVMHSDGVECSVINTEAPTSIFFYKKHS